MLSKDELEKLKKLARSKEEVSFEKKTRYQKQIEKFLQDNNVRGGTTVTPLYVIYGIYVEQTPANRASPIELGRVLSKIFKRTKAGRYHCYHLNGAFPTDTATRKKYLRRYEKKRQGKKTKHQKTVPAQD